MREEYAAAGPDVILSRAARATPSRARLDAARTVARPAESARLRDRRVLPPVRGHAGLSELQRVARRSRRGRRAAGALPLLQLLGARADAVRCAPARTSNRPASAPSASKPSCSERCPRRARRAPRSRCRPPQRRARRAAGAIPRRRDRRARRHADDREGPRLSARDARRRRVGRRRARHWPTSAPSERTFQLLTQVAGRAGRGEQPGEAIVQTLYPDHYSIQLACRQDYRGVLRARAAVPPGDALSAVRLAHQHRRPRADVRRARWTMPRDRRSGCASAAERGGDLRVLGPAPAPLGKLRGEYRAQFLIKGTNRKQMREALTRRASPTAARSRDGAPCVDVDPSQYRVG